MTNAWGHPKLCVCPVCSSRRESELRKRIDELEARLSTQADIIAVWSPLIDELEDDRLAGVKREVALRARLVTVERERDARRQGNAQDSATIRELRAALRAIEDTKKGYQDVCWEIARSALSSTRGGGTEP